MLLVLSLARWLIGGYTMDIRQSINPSIRYITWIPVHSSIAWVALPVRRISHFNRTLFEPVAKGAVSSVYVGQPLDTIKTKLQTFPTQYHNFLDCARKIFADAGIHGFYAGTVPSLVGNIGGIHALVLLVLPLCRSMFRKRHSLHGLRSMPTVDLLPQKQNRPRSTWPPSRICSPERSAPSSPR